jgi:anti-anti-sigma regulatory factor
MFLSEHGKIVVENRGPGLRIVRFTHPDVRDQIYDAADIERSRLFRDLQTSALRYVGEREALIVNLGLVERFSSELYSMLLRVRETLASSKGCVILCGPNEETQSILELFKAEHLFGIAKTEAQALEMAAQFTGRLGRDVSVSVRRTGPYSRGAIEERDFRGPLPRRGY